MSRSAFASFFILTAVLSADTLVVDLGGFNASQVQLINSTPFTGTFQQFNPALGTLTGVSIGWTNENLETFLDATAQAAGSSVAGNAVNDDDLALPGYGYQGFFFLNTLFTCSVPGNEEEGFCDDPVTNSSLGNSNPGEALPFSPSTLLNTYTGTGTLPFSITPNLAYATTVNTGTTTVSPDVSGQDINNAQDVFLIYTFTDAPSVPEPGSLALLGGGLLLVGMIRRSSGTLSRLEQ